MTKVFDFGKNWINFSKNIDEKRIELATNSLTNLIGIDFKNKSRQRAKKLWAPEVISKKYSLIYRELIK